MIARKPRQLQPEISLHRSRDVRRPAGINTPASVLVLVIKNMPRCLLEALRVPGPKQRVQQNVIRLKGSIGLKLPTPISFFVLLREKILSRPVDGDRDPAHQVVNLPKSHLRHCGRTKGGGLVHSNSCQSVAPRNSDRSADVLAGGRGGVLAPAQLPPPKPQLPHPEPPRSSPQSPEAIQTAHSPA